VPFTSKFYKGLGFVEKLIYKNIWRWDMIDSFVNADFVIQVGGIYPVFKGHTDLYAYGIVGLFSSMKTTDFTGEMSHFVAHLHIDKETGLIVQITTFQYDGVGKDLVGPMKLIALATPEEWKKF
jgi:hypothetical protein